MLRLKITGFVLSLLALLLAGCAAPAKTAQPLPPTAAPAPTAAPTAPAPATPPPAAPTASASATPASFTDAFAYCASVGTLDSPDQRYSGPKITDEIIQGYLKAAGIPANSAYSDIYKKMTIWRCMDKKVIVCNFGANLPCDSKADTSRTPTQAMDDFCSQNLDSDFIPMSVTGHATIYSWHCLKDKAALQGQIEKVDAQGYLAGIWYPVLPGQWGVYYFFAISGLL